MSATFKVLGSSSGGNCAILQTAHTKVLLDAGFTAKKINTLLGEIGESVDSIDAIFLTHEHTDHAQGLRGLSRRADLPVFANRDTADAVQAKICRPVQWKIFQTGTEFTFRDFTIRTFQLPHDAYDPVGFRISWGEEGDLFSQPGSLGWITDLGYVPANVMEHMRNVETLFIEANYDETLLEKDEKRPWVTKQRIRGRHGHLSNSATYEAIESLLPNSQLQKLYLGHLSKDCNKPALVREKFASLENKISIQVIDPTDGTSPALREAI